MSITKNKQSDEKIIEIAKLAFPNKKVSSIEELKGGMCNAAYIICFDDGHKSVLKVASNKKDGYLRNEYNLMETEVEAMNIAFINKIKGVPKVYFYDNSCKVCSGKYFFMEAIEGEEYIILKNNITVGENQNISREIGLFQKKLAKINNNYFGIVGHNEKFDSFFNFIYKLFENIISDAKDMDIDININTDEILKKLEEDREVFNEVRTSVLVHWDMWEGNIFVNNGKINGVIDWERSMWGEVLMDDRFRSHNLNKYFLEGIGIKNFTLTEKTRLYWYDLFLYMTMTIESIYRNYKDDNHYNWSKASMLEAWQKISF